MRGPAGWPPLTQNFGYADPANRLLTASEAGGWAQTYGYDAFGNRTVVPNASGAPIYAPNSGYTPVQGQSLVANQFTTHNQWVRGASANCASVPSPTAGDQYDCAGNQTALAQAGTSSQYNTPASTFSYDGENRLLVAAIGNQGGASFVYDGEGRRVQKITPSATTTYIHDAKGELAMEVSTAAPTASGTEYLTADTLGSTRLITDGSGNPQRCIDYLPFGEEIPVGMNGRTGPCYETLGSGGLSPTGPEYPAGADIAAQKFTGKERDAETGLDYFGARYFSGAQGRFTSPDDVFADQHAADPQSWNLYAYVRNNPLRGIDLDGHSPSCLDPRNCRGMGQDLSMGLLSNAEDHAETVQAVTAEMDRSHRDSSERNRGSFNELEYKTIKTKAGSEIQAIQWKLAKKSKIGGQIVQHITTTDTSGEQRNDYWEASQVPAKSKFTVYHGTFLDIDDMFKDPAGWTVHAEARFYEGLQLPGSFITNNPNTAAHELPSTTQNPNLPTDAATDPVVRTWTAPK